MAGCPSYGNRLAPIPSLGWQEIRSLQAQTISQGCLSLWPGADFCRRRVAENPRPLVGLAPIFTLVTGYLPSVNSEDIRFPLVPLLASVA